jgi:hypothetical protein
LIGALANAPIQNPRGKTRIVRLHSAMPDSLARVWVGVLPPTNLARVRNTPPGAKVT